MVAQSPYAASKIAADQLSISYYKAFNLPVKIIRPFNIWIKTIIKEIIPTIISQSILKKTISVGNISPSRDFLRIMTPVMHFYKFIKIKIYMEK